jgi:hypothetical protein
MLCVIYSAIFNKVLETGNVPDALRAVSLTPLLKQSRTSTAKPDASIPDNYRGIVCENAVTKIISLVILRRLTHWTERNKIISAEQVAFQANRSAEQHLYTLLETITHELRHDREVHVLFVDLTKAYDKVHRPLLFKILERMHIPAALVNLLRSLFSETTAKLKMNGHLSSPFTISTGTPQGNVLSPLLFNLYIEPLIRYVKKSAGISGIRIATKPNSGVPEVTVKCAVYADDFASPHGSAPDMVACANTVIRWSTAFGMEPNFSPGKTEAMLFRRDPVTKELRTNPELPAPLQLDNNHMLRYVNEYKYLGLHLRTDLDMSHEIAAMNTRLQFNAARLIYGNNVVKALSPATKTIILRAGVIGSILYLTGILPPAAAGNTGITRIATQVRNIVRSTLGVQHNSYPNTAVTANSLQLDFKHIVSTARLRLKLTLEDPSRSDFLAARVHAAISHEIAPPADPHAQTRRKLVPWYTHTKSMLVSYGLNPDTAGRDQLPSTNGAFGAAAHMTLRTKAFDEFASQTAASANGGLGMPLVALLNAAPEEVSPTHIVRRPHQHPPSTSTAQNVAAHLITNVPRTLGHRKGTSPIGVNGPACSGSLLALTRHPSSIAAPLLYNITGRLALLHHPYASSGIIMLDRVSHAAVAGDDGGEHSPCVYTWKPSQPRFTGIREHVITNPDMFPVVGTAGFSGESLRNASHPKPGTVETGALHLTVISSASKPICILCGNADDSPYHILIECKHQDVVAARQIRISKLPEVVNTAIAALMTRLVRHPCLLSLPTATRPVFDRPLFPHNFIWDWSDAATSAICKFIVWRMLLCMPWHLDAVKAFSQLGQHTLQHWSILYKLSLLFTAVNCSHHNLRHLADEIVLWASESVTAIAFARAAALARVRSTFDRLPP